MLLTVRHLTIDFGGKEAVKNVSFDLGLGESLGIVGESGSGKSATALAVMGLLPASAKVTTGEIRLDGVNLLSPPRGLRFRGNRMAMIFQEPMTSLNPLYTIGFQVVETIRQHQAVTRSQAEQHLLQLLEEVQLPKRLRHRYPHELSGGQVQRVMIAIALGGNPEILIADEPTTALDVTVQAAILQLLGQLRHERQMALLFISHDLGVVSQVCDRVMVMYQGQVVETGQTQALFRHPHHPYTRGLIACRPRPHLRLKYLPTIGDYMTQQADGTLVSQMPRNARLGEVAVARTPGPEEVPLLQVSHLRVEYPGKVVAVEEVSFAVYPGETLGIVGESGCGKTTTARALVGLVRPTKGQMLFLNQPLQTDRATRRKIQMIFQDPNGSLNPRMTIEDTLLEPLYVHRLHRSRGEKQRHVIQLLEKVGLGKEVLCRYPHSFSGGQRQRISIARALILNPQLLIADEAVSALDVSVQAQVLNLLKSLQAELGLTYIFISHDLSVVRFMSDRILVMYQGKVAEEGTAEAIYQRPQSAYTQELIRSVPDFNLG